MSIAVDASGASSGVDNVAKAFANLEKYLSSMDRTLTGIEQGLNKTGTVASKASQNLDKSSKSFDKVEKEAKQAGDSIKDAGQDMDGMNGAVAKLNGTLGMLKGAFVGAMAFAGLGSVMQTVDAMKTLDGQIKMATGSAEKHAFAMSEIERIAMANKVSLSSVGEMYVSNERALKQLGKSQEEVVKFTEQVTTAMRLGGGSAEGQAAALTQLGQSLASGVLRGDEFNSIAEQAPMIMELMADSLNVTTGELRKMAGEGKLTADVVYKAMTSAGATKKLASMASQTSTTIGGALENVRTQWDLALHSLMNSEGGISSIIAGGIGLIGASLSKFGDYIPQINEYISGVISKAKELGTAFLESDAGKAAIEGLKIAFDGLKAGVEGVASVADSVTQFFRENPELAIALASGIGAVAAAFGAFKLIVLGVTAVTTAWTAVTVGAAAALAVLTSPIALTIAAITALVAIGVYLYRNWDELPAKASEIWNGIKETVSNAWEGIKSLFSTDIFANIWEAIKESAGKAFDNVKSAISEKLNGAKDTAKSAMDNVASAIENSGVKNAFIAAFDQARASVTIAMSGIQTAVTVGITAVKAMIQLNVQTFAIVFNTVFNSIKTIVQTAFGVIKGIVTGDIGAVKSAIQNGLSQLAGIARNAITQMLSVFKSAGAQMRGVGGDIMQGFINGVKAKMGEALNTAREMANKVVSTVKSALDIHSPSRVMREIGAWAGEGFVLGVGDKVGDAKQVAENLANALTSTVADLHRQNFMLLNTANPLAELQYKVQFGELAELTDKQKERVLELARANLDLAKSNDINKSISNEIDGIYEKIQTHGMDRIQLMEWQIENTNKYAGASANLIEQLKEQIRHEETLNQLVSAKSKRDGYQGERDKNSYLYRNKTDKYAGERWDLSQQGFDARQVAEILGMKQQADVMSAMANMPKSLTMPTLQNNNVGSAVSSTVTGYIDIKKQFDENLKIIQQAQDGQLITEQEAYDERLAQDRAFHEARQNLMMLGADNVLGAMANSTKAMLGEQSSAYRAMFALQQSFAVGAAIVNIHKAISDAFAEGTTLTQKFAGMATATAQGMKIVSAIQQIRNPVIGQAHDGIMSVPKSGTWNLEKGERVLPKHTAQALDDKLASTGNGKPVNVIIHNHGNAQVAVEEQSNGDLLVMIDKMIDAKVDTKVNQRFIQARRQGGELYGR